MSTKSDLLSCNKCSVFWLIYHELLDDSIHIEIHDKNFKVDFKLADYSDWRDTLDVSDDLLYNIKQLYGLL